LGTFTICSASAPAALLALLVAAGTHVAVVLRKEELVHFLTERARGRFRSCGMIGIGRRRRILPLDFSARHGFSARRGGACRLPGRLQGRRVRIVFRCWRLRRASRLADYSSNGDCRHPHRRNQHQGLTHGGSVTLPVTSWHREIDRQPGSPIFLSL